MLVIMPGGRGTASMTEKLVREFSAVDTHAPWPRESSIFRVKIYVPKHRYAAASSDNNAQAATGGAHDDRRVSLAVEVKDRRDLSYVPHQAMVF